jgi:GT2 family glycosyltransferase
MNKIPDVSVIIVSYNTRLLTENAIKSVLKEGSKIEKETIVVDNGSTDGSGKMLRNYEKKGKIKLIENEGNLGFAKANNQAIKIARGRHKFLLNSDTIVKKGSIGVLIEFVQNHPDAGVIGSRLYNGDGSLQGSCQHFPTVANAIREYWFGKDGLFEKYAPKGSKPVEVESVVGAAFFISQKAIEKVGMLDERYFFYFEDIDYCRKVKKANLKVYYLPRSEIVHYHGVSGRKVADQANQWRRLIPSSKIYHGLLKHYLITFVLWTGQKWQNLLG